MAINNSFQTGFSSIQQMQDSYLKNESLKNRNANNRSVSKDAFQALLNSKTAKVTENKAINIPNLDEKEKGIKFSKHATYRLEERGISLSDEQLKRLEEGTAKAGVKGINESLVLVDKLAFIVNVPNNTVITAMEQENAEENIFTNIDGAVII